MTRYRVTYTRPDGGAAVLHLIAANDWAAWAALFDALSDDVHAVRLKRCA